MSFVGTEPAQDPKPSEDTPDPATSTATESHPAEDTDEAEPVITDPEVIVDADPEPHAPMAEIVAAEAELSEEQMDKQSQHRSAAQEFASSGDFASAIDEYTAALLISPSSMLYAKRASAFLKIAKPKAAIRDCSAAIDSNPDSARALKVRGTAYRMLGMWEQAARDLQEGNRIDMDEESYEVQKLVESHWNVIRDHRMNQEAKKRQREGEERAAKIRQVTESRQEAAARAVEEETNDDLGGNPFGGMNLPPDVAAKMADPAVAAKLQKMMSDLQTNPMEAMKYMSDPDLQPILAALQSSMGGAGGRGAQRPPPTGQSESVEEVNCCSGCEK